MRNIRYILMMCAGSLWSIHASAKISEATVSDVTTRAFSVVWQSSEPVTSATLHVYTDSQGKTEVTNTLNIQVVSPPNALNLGIVKVDVTGLSADSLYYLKTETLNKKGDKSLFPLAADPLLNVNTASETTRSDESGNLIANDLIQHPIYEPDSSTPSAGTLLLVSAPGLSAYPVSAFVGDGYAAPNAVADLNNLYSKTSSKSLSVPGGTVIELIENRGLLCDPPEQPLIRLRLTPNHTESFPKIEINTADTCFAPNGKPADFNCDHIIGYGDFNLFLGKFGISTSTKQPSCKYNSDFDLNADKSINYGDFNLFLSVFGAKEAAK